MVQKNPKIKELIEDFLLDNKDFGYGSYTGMARGLRALIIKKFEEKGIDIRVVAEMNDWEIEKYFQDEGFVPLMVNYKDSADYEQIWLIPIEELVKYDHVSR